MNFSHVYNKLKDTPFDDYDYFLKTINDSYLSLFERNYVIVNDNTPSYDIDTLSIENLHDSFNIILNKSVKFSCLMTPYDVDSCNSLFVIFSGARSVKTDSLPIFKRWSYFPFIDSAVLNIADPMFYKFNNLSLGWYYGTPTESYIQYISLIINKICSILKISHNNLFLFGSSGGGYAALQLSLYIKNAIHVAINPQVSISKFFYSREFTRLTGIDLQAHDPHRRNDTLNIIRENLFNKTSKYLILFNVQDKEDCIYHLFPLLQGIGIDKVHLGLNNSDNFLLWMYSCVGGHYSQGDQLIFSHIMYLANKLSKSEFISDFDQYLIKNISILWKQIEHYKALSRTLSNKINNA